MGRAIVKERALRSDALFLTAAAIWGFAFVAQRVGMSHVGPFTFNAIRFALGAAALAPLLLLRNRGEGGASALAPPLMRRRGKARAGPPASRGAKRELTLSFGLLGSILFAGASLQQMGIAHTTAGKAGFITGLYVVIVPLLGLLWRQRPSAGAWIGAGLAAAGLYLLSVQGGLDISRGDSLVLASAAFFAVHVIAVGWLSGRMDPIRMAFFQFAACSALSFLAAFATETMTVAGVLAASLPIAYAGVLSVGVAYTLQIVAQREAPPGHAAIILSLEAAFAAIGGGVILGEGIPARGLAGCGLMLAGAFVSRRSVKKARGALDHREEP